MCWGYKAGELLLEPLKIYCTVDVQKRRLVYVVRAWFAGMGSMLLEHGELWGETDQDGVWDQLSDLIDTEYDGHSISMTGIDIGYRDDQVYRFINDGNKNRVIALRGRDKLDKPFRKEIVEVDKKGKTRKRGDARWAFDSPFAKRWVHGRFNREDTRTGWWLLHQQVSEGYCKEIVGEEWREAEGIFVKVGENHALDCEAMQYIMALRDKLQRRKLGALTRVELMPAIKAGPVREEVDEDLQEDEPEAAPAPAAPRSPPVTAKPAARQRKADAPPAKARGGRFKIIKKPTR